jgi:site-specific DNA-methyltransferase (adenine-specific)
MKPYYADDSVTLYHGDCREVTAWLEADVLVTDPPYGIQHEKKQGSSRVPKSRGGTQTRTRGVLAGDATTAARDDALDLWGERPALVFGSWRMPRPVGTVSRLIWHKAGSTPGPARAAFLSNDEEVYVLGAFPATSPPERTVLTTHEIRHGSAGASARIGHPTPKPLDLMERLLLRCPPGTIADPFAGSGSTLVAAKQLGRKAIGVELEERYCEIIAKRLAQGVLDFGSAS